MGFFWWFCGDGWLADLSICMVFLGYVKDGRFFIVGEISLWFSPWLS
jgi:hypothetical protein